jgi:hypothetical protein
MKTYQVFAQHVSRYWTYTNRKELERARIIQEGLESLVKENLPRGSGFDAGTTLVLEKSSQDLLVFNTSFHHMNDGGFYDGWTHHNVRVKASLLFDFQVTVGGINRREIKDYIGETFHHVMSLEMPFSLFPEEVGFQNVTPR